ncbi:MAG TPA: hypothetical protein VF761_17120 [Gemmatimonadaceae bacterium]
MSAHTAAMLFILREHFGSRRLMPGCRHRIGDAFENVKVSIARDRNGGQRFRFRCRKCSNAGSALAMQRLRARLARAVPR